jgi:23S rRNA C2498 (ribose-2'-O)-methylase RlmM
MVGLPGYPLGDPRFHVLHVTTTYKMQCLVALGMHANINPYKMGVPQNHKLQYSNDSLGLILDDLRVHPF